MVLSASAPPILLIYGTDDDLVPMAQSERFRNQLRAANVSSELYPVQGGAHGIRRWESERLTGYKAAMVRWLTERLARP